MTASQRISNWWAFWTSFSEMKKARFWWWTTKRHPSRWLRSTADDNGQMTAYAYLLAANKYVFPTSPVKCRFDLFRKLKTTPKLEHVHTIRTAADRRRFAKIANAVLAAIDAGIFMPQPSWMCADCAYSDACKAW